MWEEGVCIYDTPGVHNNFPKLTYLFDKINPNPSFEDSPRTKSMQYVINVSKEEEDMQRMKRLRKEVVDGGNVLLYLARSRTYNRLNYHITIHCRTIRTAKHEHRKLIKY